jgi:hypothetical protein
MDDAVGDAAVGILQNGVYLSREVFFGQEKTVGIRFMPRNCARRHGSEALLTRGRDDRR